MPPDSAAGAPILERLELRVDRRDLVVLALDRRAEHRREEAQVLFDAQVGIQREAAGHVADARAQRPESRFTTSRPSTRARARVGHQQRHQNAEQRRLAGAVGTDEAEQLARAHRERHAVERDGLPERLLEPLDDDAAVG